MSSNDVFVKLKQLAVIAEIDPKGLREALGRLSPEWISNLTGPTVPNSEYTKTRLPKWRSLSVVVAKILKEQPVSAIAIRELAEMFSDDQECRGVSLRDCGIALDLMDDELSDFVREFSDSKKVTAKPLGKCPNDKRANLYRLSEVLKNLQNFRKLDGCEKEKLRKHLMHVQRMPAG
jgi:hypothetical protein